MLTVQKNVFFNLTPHTLIAHRTLWLCVCISVAVGVWRGRCGSTMATDIAAQSRGMWLSVGTDVTCSAFFHVENVFYVLSCKLSECPSRRCACQHNTNIITNINTQNQLYHFVACSSELASTTNCVPSKFLRIFCCLFVLSWRTETNFRRSNTGSVFYNVLVGMQQWHRKSGAKGPGSGGSAKCSVTF